MLLWKKTVQGPDVKGTVPENIYPRITPDVMYRERRTKRVRVAFSKKHSRLTPPCFPHKSTLVLVVDIFTSHEALRTSRGG